MRNRGATMTVVCQPVKVVEEGENSPFETPRSLLSKPAAAKPRKESSIESSNRLKQ